MKTYFQKLYVSRKFSNSIPKLDQIVLGQNPDAVHLVDRFPRWKYTKIVLLLNLIPLFLVHINEPFSFVTVLGFIFVLPTTSYVSFLSIKYKVWFGNHGGVFEVDTFSDHLMYYLINTLLISMNLMLWTVAICSATGIIPAN